MTDNADEKPWMPDCTCGRDPAFFRHESQCPLRYWYEAAELRAEVKSLKRRLSDQESPAP